MAEEVAAAVGGDVPPPHAVVSKAMPATAARAPARRDRVLAWLLRMPMFMSPSSGFPGAGQKLARTVTRVVVLRIRDGSRSPPPSRIAAASVQRRNLRG